MSLFNFLKRKPVPAIESDGPSPDYAFAHLALRQIALSDPLQFLAIAASPDSNQFIDAVLQDVADHCGRKTSFDATTIKIHPTSVNTFPCVVIELPDPKEMTEAFMVALVVMIDISSEPPPDMDDLSARYFTLEKSFSTSNEPRTVLAEWNTESHLNYGDGPTPTIDNFVAILGEYV